MEEYQELPVKVKAVCQHIYVNGIKTVHQKNASGGCTTTYYTVVVCKECGYIKSKSVCGTFVKPTCTH